MVNYLDVSGSASLLVRIRTQGAGRPCPTPTPTFGPSPPSVPLRQLCSPMLPPPGLSVSGRKGLSSEDLLLLLLPIDHIPGVKVKGGAGHRLLPDPTSHLPALPFPAQAAHVPSWARQG